jgi:drug/metabolite transporter (DMT)-like permease
MRGWLAFAFLALINSLVGFFFWYRALAIGGVPKISQIQLLQTFFTFGFAALWLNETITLTMIFCLIATIVVVWISKKIPVASTAGN